MLTTRTSGFAVNSLFVRVSCLICINCVKRRIFCEHFALL